MEYTAAEAADAYGELAEVAERLRRDAVNLRHELIGLAGDASRVCSESPWVSREQERDAGIIAREAGEGWIALGELEAELACMPFGAMAQRAYSASCDHLRAQGEVRVKRIVLGDHLERVRR